MRNERTEVHKDICNEIHELYENKNHDYGDSFINVRQEVDRAIVVRLMDKIERLKVITRKEQKVVDETIDDTLMDLANYAIMELTERRIEKSKLIYEPALGGIHMEIDSKTKKKIKRKMEEQVRKYKAIKVEE